MQSDLSVPNFIRINLLMIRLQYPRCTAHATRSFHLPNITTHHLASTTKSDQQLSSNAHLNHTPHLLPPRAVTCTEQSIKI